MQNSGEIVYGVCLPATGFSALFVVISLVTVVSILVSGFVCYQRQLQKVAEESAPKQTPAQQVGQNEQNSSSLHNKILFLTPYSVRRGYDL